MMYIAEKNIAGQLSAGIAADLRRGYTDSEVPATRT